MPINTLPSPEITKGVLSGFSESSTRNAAPVPVCVILTKSVELSPETLKLIDELEGVKISNFADGDEVPIPKLVPSS